MFWNDVNDPRGFTIFDTETTITHVDNPYRMFYNVYYEDTPINCLMLVNIRIKKVIVRKN